MPAKAKRVIDLDDAYEAETVQEVAAAPVVPAQSIPQQQCPPQGPYTVYVISPRGTTVDDVGQLIYNELKCPIVSAVAERSGFVFTFESKADVDAAIALSEHLFLNGRSLIIRYWHDNSSYSRGPRPPRQPPTGWHRDTAPQAPSTNWSLQRDALPDVAAPAAPRSKPASVPSSTGSWRRDTAPPVEREFRFTRDALAERPTDETAVRTRPTPVVSKEPVRPSGVQAASKFAALADD